MYYKEATFVPRGPAERLIWVEKNWESYSVGFRTANLAIL